MQFLTDSHIDFMKYRGVFVWVSLILLTVAIVELALPNAINFGIDFEGGTQLTIKTREAMDSGELRQTFEAAGMREAQIQRYGAIEERQMLIKTPIVEGSEEGRSQALIEALDRDLNGDSGGKVDLNQRGSGVVGNLLIEADPDERLSVDEDVAREYYESVAEALLERRKVLGLFETWDQVAATPGLSEAARGVLESRAYLGAFHVIQNENVGPQIGGELTRKGVLAVVLSFFGMLLYIWYRFELRFGVGALVAVFHDFLITLGLFAILNFEFNLSTIAAFLTLVGYSVNDTVVIFDRVRENRRKHRRMPMVDVMNLSINQTLSRTVLTSGTTLMVVGCLFFFGGEVIRGFAFVLLIGVIIGTYSSVFVASPFTLLWERYFGQEARERRHGQGQARKPA